MEYSPVFVVLLGLGTVFVGLILLVFMTLLMGRIITAVEKSSKTTEAAPAVPAPAQPQISAAETDQMVAAVAAAIAEELGTDITGIRIVSMKRI